MNKYISLFIIIAIASGCSARNIKQNCDYFKESDWSLITERSSMLKKLSKTYESRSPNRKEAWFRSQNQKLGLCRYTQKPPSSPFANSCSSSYIVFIKENGEWIIDNEAITLCSSH